MFSCFIINCLFGKLNIKIFVFLEALMKKVLFLLFVLLFYIGVVYGQVFNVSDTAGFQSALTTAQSNGEDDTINVAAGTYNVSTVLTYTTPDGDGGHSLTIIGAGASSTILDGGNNNAILNIDTDNNADHTGDSGANVIIEDLTFRNGNTSGKGGAVYVNTGEADISLSKTNFESNHSDDDGGGFYIEPYRGNVSVSESNIDNNSGDYGGGGNIHTQHGAVIFTRNYVYSNTADTSGGGVYIYAPFNEMTVSDNYFRNNEAGGGASGGAIFTHTNSGGVANIINNTFSENRAGWYGGGALLGAYNYDNVIVNVYNNIFWNNIANYGNNDGDDLLVIVGTLHSIPTVNLYNNDFSGNADFNTGQSEDLYITDTTNYNHSANLQVDPQFVSSSDLHLSSTSQIIDEGLNSAPRIPSVDLDGRNRIINGTVDMGAYEYDGARNVLTSPTSVPTVNEWGMIILSVLSIVSAVIFIRRKSI
jgi:hypothetical protein